MMLLRWSSCFLRTSIRTASIIGESTDGKRRRAVTQSLPLELARRYSGYSARKREYLQMGMISIAGAPILNSKNETRRPSFIKTKDQEMVKLWKRTGNNYRTWNHRIKGNYSWSNTASCYWYSEGVFIRKKSSAENNYQDLQFIKIFLRFRVKRFLWQIWNKTGSMLIQLLGSFCWLQLSNALLKVIQCRKLSEYVSLTLADCHFRLLKWAHPETIPLQSEIIQAWLSLWHCKMTSALDFLSYSQCSWKWSR